MVEALYRSIAEQEAAKCLADISKARSDGTLTEVRRVKDTAQGGDIGWLGYERADCAIIFYEDDPDCAVSVGNHPGRFVELRGDTLAAARAS